MTEADWLACDNPLRMLRFLRRRMSRRKLRLFLGEAYLPINQGWAPLTPDELATLPAELDLWARGLLRPETLHPTSSLGAFLGNMAEALGGYFDFARLVWDNDWLDAHRLTAAQSDAGERRRLARLLVELAGNPFRPMTADPSWLTSTVTDLARQMYESRDFSVMPILGDALQDAGCEQEDVLNHCCDPQQVHCRGCWVVDLILGKE